MSSANIVGERIHAWRRKRRLSVEELAGAIPGDGQANAKLIAGLEAGELVPSLTPLLQIARALGVRLGSFLDDQTSPAPVVVRGDSLDSTARFVGSNLGGARSELDFHSLAANKSDRHMEPFLIDVKPHSGAVALSTHEGEEFVYVLSGAVEIAYGKEAYLLHAGDSIYYDSIIPHHLHAAGGSEARILAVVYAPA